MIKRINKLKNVGRFVDLRSQSGTQGDFSELNVIYAQNATGKSTICDVLRSLSTRQPEYVTGRKRFGSNTDIEIEVLLHGTPTPKAVLSNGRWLMDPAGIDTPYIMIYDERFVAENVLVGQHVSVEQRRNLYGLVIGAPGLILKQQVDTAEQELSNATSALNNAKLALNSLIPDGWSIESFRAFSKDDSIDQRIREMNDELDSAKRIKKISDAIRQRKLLQISIPSVIPEGLSEMLGTTLDDIATNAEAQIRDHLERYSSDLDLEWIRQGYKAQTGTHCPHCGQEMEGLDILKAYRAFFSGMLQEQQTAQQSLLNAVENGFGIEAQQKLQQTLHAHIVERDWWRDAGEWSYDLPPCEPESIISAMAKVHSAITGAVHRKQANPSISISLNKDEHAAVTLWEEKANIIARYMDGLSGINTAIVERQRAAGSMDVVAIERKIVQLTIQKKRHEQSVIIAYTNYDSAVTTKTMKEQAKTAANAALRQQSETVLQNYGERINALLSTFQADFRIICSGVTFRGGPPSGELAVEILGTRISSAPEDAQDPSIPSLANTLSAGDRSALGLAFFLAVIEHDSNLGNMIVVFDDPFHSQDRSRRRRTIEAIHRVANHSKQCFVLSHDLDFAREAARVAGVAVNTFKIDPMADHSILQAGELPPLPTRSYEKDYAKLTGYLRDPTAYSTQLKDIARCLRQTLEGYLHSKFPEAWAETDWLGVMIDKIRAAQQGDFLHMATHLEADLTAVNEYSKRFYHHDQSGSDATDVDPRELKGYVEQTLKIISK